MPSFVIPFYYGSGSTKEKKFRFLPTVPVPVPQHWSIVLRDNENLN